MGYIVVHAFMDLEDEKRVYEVGDTFPATKRKVSKKRIEELSTTNNKLNEILIEKIKE